MPRLPCCCGTPQAVLSLPKPRPSRTLQTRDTAKAAQWCVEHGLMDQKLGGRFAPDNSDPAYKTLNAYQQLVG